MKEKGDCMYRISKRFHFSSAHILETSYTVACQKIHGHNYNVEVVLCSNELNRDGMVVDFGKLKQSMADIIDLYDHKMLLKSETIEPMTEDDGRLFLPCNPTAENIARLIYKSIDQSFLDTDREKTDNGYERIVHIEKIRVWETDSAWAEYSE